ncbi:hypothetical protein FF098_000405 [Parvularcula flava]|uniref:Uncharacterized protein n=1 Tax=Aquisalinus luteolus TaxID=1566827 RepID=A0A8J3A4M6_9PROT|nr:hypothetical protein [Aquisalinus luteolus]NHK26362.1 hypothetical protein [Aquisalinus luteolus]GGH92103.1 hypothetical protein GCM10011355_00810 [Aquisalinus luteolus]
MLTIRFSCVVDKGDIFANQSMRWARSLIEIAGVEPQDIIVHHTPETDPDRVAAFASLGIRTEVIERVSEKRPHMNKVAQLRTPFLQQADLAVLCDCDTVFVSDPRPYLKRGQAGAVVVDLPSPPMKIWNRLLKQSGLARQREDIPAGSVPEVNTLFENRNGGLYVLPGKMLARLDQHWRKWADWTEERAELLGQHAFHVDQISFALTCLELKIDLALLPRALNFPTHQPAEKIGNGAPVMMHYHRAVDRRGRLKPTGQPVVDNAIAHVNARLSAPAKFSRRQKLVLHVGLPKTGTSSLQSWCYNHRKALAGQGICYPTPNSGTAMPKHQFIVNDLHNATVERTAKALEESSDGTLVLSTEGLTNHLYDFRPAALEMFRELTKDHDMTVFLVRRKPEDWLRSYHKQCETNQKSDQYCYGQGLTLEEFSRQPRIARFLDSEALRADCVAAFGGAGLVMADYEDDWVGKFFDVCGYEAPGEIVLPRVNQSLPGWLFEGVVRINRLPLSPTERAAWLGSLHVFASSNHAGLAKYARTAKKEGHWGSIDPALTGHVTGAEHEWRGYGTLIAQLRKGLVTDVTKEPKKGRKKKARLDDQQGVVA